MLIPHDYPLYSAIQCNIACTKLIRSKVSQLNQLLRGIAQECLERQEECILNLIQGVQVQMILYLT